MDNKKQKRIENMKAKKLEADYHQACCYQYGIDGDVDYNKAFAFYRKCAMQGYAPAQNALGFMYLSGEGINRDDTLAFKWLKSAADQDYAPALLNISYLYIDGIGTDIDVQKGLNCIYAAAKKGCDDARFTLESRIAECMGIDAASIFGS